MVRGKRDEGAREAGKDPGIPNFSCISRGPHDGEAIHNALREWPNGGMPFPKQDIRNPEDFARWPRWSGPRISRTAS